MDLRSKYRLITFTTTIIVCVIVLLLNFFSHKQTLEIYSGQVADTIIHQKKDFLKDTVNNIFLEIDRLRLAKKDTYEQYTQSRLKRFNEEMNLSDEDFAKYFIYRFSEDSTPEMWTALLWNENNDKILYTSLTPDANQDAASISGGSIESQIQAMKSGLISCAEIKKGDLQGIFGISTTYLNNSVKTEVADLIRSRKFSNDSYIWVNEIINYEGGDNYAIRRVHPNLPETEGTYLSTSMEDIAGNLPYLEELEGVKKDGELFFTYNFKKMNSEKISEKITYAKLYKDYNWVIAMGVHLDDIDTYISTVQDAVDDLTRMQIFKMLFYILLVLIAGFVTLSIIENRHLTISTSSLEEEVNLDNLTKANSRRCGEVNLDKFFNKYKLTGENPAIMMFDIDDFKSINDKSGHGVGDQVLIQVVKKVNSLIRSSDQLIRWGGDEFLGIFPGMKEEHVMEFCLDILRNIENMEIQTEKGIIKTTISAGITYFEGTDTSWEDALKRADEAMYKSKNQGKNQVTR